MYYVPVLHGIYLNGSGGGERPSDTISTRMMSSLALQVMIVDFDVHHGNGTQACQHLSSMARAVQEPLHVSWICTCALIAVCDVDRHTVTGNTSVKVLPVSVTGTGVTKTCQGYPNRCLHRVTIPRPPY